LSGMIFIDESFIEIDLRAYESSIWFSVRKFLSRAYA
jgi:hypothetical protein